MLKNLPNHNDTKVQVYSRAIARGCLPEVKAVFAKYEAYFQNCKTDWAARYQLTVNLIQELGDIDMQLIFWLCDEYGNIRINNVVAFTIEDVPDEIL